VHNKADQSGIGYGINKNEKETTIVISAKEGKGIDALRQHLRGCMGLEQTTQGEFIARRRHLDAIERGYQHLQDAKRAMGAGMEGELIAEDLRLCQNALSEITGEFSADDLLGEIFSSFCIGK